MSETQHRHQIEVFLSNRLETLFHELDRHVSEEGSLFSQRLIIVPSRPMESYIKQKLADRGIYSAITFSFLENGVSRLAHTLFEPSKTSSLPNFLELVFKLLNALQSCSELKDYLKSANRDKKLIHLASTLAVLAKRYAIYGKKGWINEIPDWQKEIWEHIFPHESSFLSELTLKKGPRPDLSIDLFSFNHLPPLYLHFFQKVAAVCDTRLYTLSPCAYFWTDALSIKESRFYLKRLEKEGISQASREALQSYLKQSHPLLLSLGKVGKKHMKLLETTECPLNDLYDEPPLETQLGRLQADLLSMTQEVGPYDGTIEFYSTVTKLQEIEVLKENLIKLLNECPDLEPKDIVVMAPDIVPYHPFITCCFDEELTYTITDLPVKTDNPKVRGVVQLLDLTKRRFSASAVLELFSHPLFQAKNKIKALELNYFKEVIEEFGISWGVNLAQRNSFLPGEMSDGGGTFEEGMAMLLKRFATLPVDDFSNLEGLEKCVLCLEEVTQDLARLEKGQMSITQWGECLLELSEKYFGFYEDDPLPKTFKRLSSADQGALLSFDIVFPLIDQLICEETTSLHKNRLQSVHFCSMLPMRAIPAKVICLIGLNHDTFPRKETLGALDHLKTIGSDYCPSRPDFDRYLFLESLLSAREKVFISFQGRSPLDYSELPPSILVSELMGYLGAAPVEVPLTFAKATDPKPFSFIQFASKPQIKGSFTLDLTTLVRACRSPLSNYFQNVLGINLYKKEPLADEEPFTLSALNRFFLKKEGVTDLSNSMGPRPLGRFKTLAESELQKEQQRVSLFLKEHDIALSDLSSYTILPTTIDLDEQTQVTVQGSIEGVTSHGLVVDQKDDFKGALLAYPNLLLLANLNHSASKQIFFTKSGKVKFRFFEDPFPLLVEFLRYTLLTMHYPLPLTPQWILPLLSEDQKSLQKKIEQAFSSRFGASYDQALHYTYRVGPLPKASVLIEQFSIPLNTTFQEMKDAWF